MSSFVVIGVNHRSAPLSLLERVSVAADDLGKFLTAAADSDHVSEAVALVTCNRTELYVTAERFHGAYAELRDLLAARGELDLADLDDHLVVHHDDDAVRHLFRVAAGLDSAVVGEHEILGQLRTAWERAQEQGTVGSLGNLVFRHAIEAGKRARTETSIARHTASVSSAAVEMAADRLGGLTGRRVLVVGAGEMADGMVVALAAAGVADVCIANRTPARAEALAERVGGRTVPLADLADELDHVDLVLTSTGASEIMVDHAAIEASVARRPGRSLLVVDVAVPRDVDPSVASLDGVTLLDMDDLARHAAAGRSEREAEVDAVEALVEEEVARFCSVRSAREMAPLVAGLRARAEELRQAELERYSGRLSGLDERQWAEVEALTKGLVAKLLHEPTVGLKDAAGSPRGDRLAASLRELFDL